MNCNCCVEDIWQVEDCLLCAVINATVLQMLKEAGYTFDIAFTSVLKRAIKTLYYVQDGMDCHWIPVVRHWRLNERMYGGLQGLNKSETAVKHGEEQVKVSLSSVGKHDCSLPLGVI